MASKPSAIRGARIVGERYVKSKQGANQDGRMPLMDHLRELRNRLIKAAVFIIAGMIVALCFSTPLLNLVARPFCEATINGMTGCKVVGDKLTITGVFDSFFLRIQIAFYIALVGTCPVWLYQVWAFIAPPVPAREEVGLPFRLQRGPAVHRRRVPRLLRHGQGPWVPARPHPA